MRGILLGGVVASALALGTAPAAQARDGIGPGGAAALGVLGGLAVGGAIAAANDPYYPGKPVYRAPRGRSMSRARSVTSSAARPSTPTATSTSGACASASDTVSLLSLAGRRGFQRSCRLSTT